MAEVRKQALVQEFIIASIRKMIRMQLDVDARLSTTDDFSDAFKSIPSEQRSNVLAFMKLSAIDYGQQDPTGTLTAVRPHALSSKFGQDLLKATGVRQRNILAGEQVFANHPKNKVSQPNLNVAEDALVASFVPAIFTIDFYYMTKDLKQLLSFMSKWAFSHLNHRLNFNLEYAGTILPIQVGLSTSLTTPEKSKLGEDAGYYQFEGQITVAGVLSNDDPRDTYIAPLIHYNELDVLISEQSVEV